MKNHTRHRVLVVFGEDLDGTPDNITNALELVRNNREDGVTPPFRVEEFKTEAEKKAFTLGLRYDSVSYDNFLVLTDEKDIDTILDSESGKMNNGRHLYQPTLKNSAEIPPELPASYCAFLSEKDCLEWLRQNGYAPGECDIEEYEPEDITGPAIWTDGAFQPMHYAVVDGKTCVLLPDIKTAPAVVRKSLAQAGLTVGTTSRLEYLNDNLFERSRWNRRNGITAIIL